MLLAAGHGTIRRRLSRLRLESLLLLPSISLSWESPIAFSRLFFPQVDDVADVFTELDVTLGTLNQDTIVARYLANPLIILLRCVQTGLCTVYGGNKRSIAIGPALLCLSVHARLRMPISATPGSLRAQRIALHRLHGSRVHWRLAEGS